jgi:nicotinamide riboside kinase
VKRVCFHGAESTGKTVLAAKFAAEWDCPVVPEYGRTYAEAHGTGFALDDLLAIAREQHRLACEAGAARPPLLILDTDPLMTAAWTEMLHGHIPDALLGYPLADHYLLFAPDVPWVEDGTRLFGDPAERDRFAAIAEAILVRVGASYCRIDGEWPERERQAREAIARLGG